VWLEDLAIEWGNWIVTVLLVYSVVAFLVQLALAWMARAELGRQRRRQLLADSIYMFESDQAPAISVLLTACNDAPSIAESVRALMQLEYPALEIVVVNDGSTDETLDCLIEAFDLRPAHHTPRNTTPRGRVRECFASPHHPRLTVVDAVRGGRARAANLGVAYARHPLVLLTDAGTVLERDALARLALPFYEDPTVAAVGCVVRPSNGSIIERGHLKYCALPASRFARLQVVEYLRSMLSARMAWTFLDSLFVHPGMIGLFSREAVRSVGGFRVGTTGEDTDLCMRLQLRAARNGQREVVRFLGDAVAWTAVPEKLRGIARQRTRWYQGLADALWFNQEMLLNGRFALHHGFVFLVLLVVDLVGPMVEAGGQVALAALASTGGLDAALLVIYFSVFLVGGTVPSLMAIALERKACPRFDRAADLEGLALYSLVENLGYRQLTSLWRFVGTLKALGGRRDPGEAQRRGRAAEADEADEQQAA
jgi:cellulose synthase/poly-beta-1,6-N-acetylglucosamine synthase-like glycosyltransferase